MRTAGIALAALIAGTVLGWALARKSSRVQPEEAAVREFAKPATGEASTPELTAARKRVVELEEQLRLVSAAPVATQAYASYERIHELRRKAEACLAAKDVAALGPLVRELSRLGPEGFAVAAALLAIVEGKGYEELGLEYSEYASLYSTLDPACLVWILDHPQAGGTEVRRQTTDAYDAIVGPKGGPQLLAWLGREPDPEIAWTLAMHLRFCVTPEMVGDLAAVVRAHAGDGTVVPMVLETLAVTEGEATEEALALFAADVDPVIREAARIEILARNPPVAGMIVTRTDTDESTSSTPLLPGDIVISIDGGIPISDSEAQRQLYQVPEGAAVAVVVRRGTQDLHLSVGHGAPPITMRKVKPR